jgi:hypothetical protein
MELFTITDSEKHHEKGVELPIIVLPVATKSRPIGLIDHFGGDAKQVPLRTAHSGGLWFACDSGDARLRLKLGCSHRNRSVALGPELLHDSHTKPGVL